MRQTLYDMLPAIGEQTGYIDSIIDVDFPHIAEKIWLFWGEPECMSYLDELLNYSHSKDRPSRQGFPFQAIVELNIVMEEHQRQFPNIRSNYKFRTEEPW